LGRNIGTKQTLNWWNNILTFMIDGNVQQYWGRLLGLCIGIYTVVNGALAREWTVTEAILGWTIQVHPPVPSPVDGTHGYICGSLIIVVAPQVTKQRLHSDT
jgi:hypothetical protein